MSKTSKSKPDDDMKAEYRFDYTKAKPNRFAKMVKGGRMVVLEPDVAEVFTTGEEVNKLLRDLIQTMPAKASKPKRKAS